MLATLDDEHSATQHGRIDCRTHPLQRDNRCDLGAVSPAISASVGPDCTTRRIVMGIRVAASTPAGTSMKPDADWPGRAVTEPIVSGPVCCGEPEGRR